MASLVAQTVKKSTCNAGDPGSTPGSARSSVTYPLILAWRIPCTEEPWQSTVHGVAESDTTEQLTYTQILRIHIHIHIYIYILSHYGLSQDIEYSSLCYTVDLVLYPFDI